MYLNLLLLDQATDAFAACFTQNAVVGNPVLIGRELLQQKLCAGVLINNRIANVSNKSGRKDAEHIINSLKEHLALQEAVIFPSSTGIIGWQLPKQEMLDSLPGLVKKLHSRSALDLAQGIMTTDAYPKARRAELGKGSILAVAKGAGMIDPDMATMLCFILTDINIKREKLQVILKEAVEESFNCISVDGDQSTSDSVFLFSSKQVNNIDEEDFKEALKQILAKLAEDIVRNGEGTEHVISLELEGAATKEEAREAAKAVINSPLVKTAVFGNDPNVGRILSALGSFYGKQKKEIDLEKLKIQIGGEIVFSDGAFQLDNQKETRLSDYLKECVLGAEDKSFPLHNKNVEIKIKLARGKSFAKVFGSDLSYEYVRENADYRT